MVNSIQAEIYKLTRRPYFYVFNLLCALFALLVVGCLAYVKYTAPSNQDAINFPFSLNILLMGMPVGLYLVPPQRPRSRGESPARPWGELPR